MQNNSKRFSWSIFANTAIAVSLVGNWIQYQSLAEKKSQLKQTQTRLEETISEHQASKEDLARKRAEMEKRIVEIDAKIEEANLEEQRSMTGFRFAPPEEKEIANSAAESARANKAKLSAERQKLQNALEAFPVESASNK